MSRRDGARRSKQKRDPQVDLSMPIPQPRRSFAPVEVLSAEQVEDIHLASLCVLRDIGIHFMGRKARDFLGTFDSAQVDGQSEIFRLSPDLVDHTIASVPRQFRLHARNPARDI